MRPRFDKWLDRPDNQADLTYEEWLDNYVAVLELDAQRYRKLKAFHKSTDRDKWDDLWNSYSNLDAAVDALPDANENPNRSR